MIATRGIHLDNLCDDPFMASGVKEWVRKKTFIVDPFRHMS